MDFSVIMISIHTPRVGRDIFLTDAGVITLRFQSTRPVWGVTLIDGLKVGVAVYFNPHAPCGA